MSKYIDRVLAEVKEKNANEPEFLQTVEEVLGTLAPIVDAHPEYEKVALLERMVEPERTIEFRGLMIMARHMLTAATVYSSTAQLDRTREAYVSLRP